jgi:hypothetical protein
VTEFNSEPLEEEEIKEEKRESPPWCKVQYRYPRETALIRDVDRCKRECPSAETEVLSAAAGAPIHLFLPETVFANSKSSSPEVDALKVEITEQPVYASQEAVERVLLGGCSSSSSILTVVEDLPASSRSLGEEGALASADRAAKEVHCSIEHDKPERFYSESAKPGSISSPRAIPESLSPECIKMEDLSPGRAESERLFLALAKAESLSPKRAKTGSLSSALCGTESLPSAPGTESLSYALAGIDRILSELAGGGSLSSAAESGTVSSQDKEDVFTGNGRKIANGGSHSSGSDSGDSKQAAAQS